MALCDAIGWKEGKPALVGKCIACGMCYYQCPMSPGSPLGDFKLAYVTKSKAEDVDGQNGATVTSLLADMLDSGTIDAAIVTVQDPGKKWYPAASIARTREEVMASRGTIHGQSPVVPAFLDAVNQGLRKIAVVTTRARSLPSRTCSTKSMACSRASTTCPCSSWGCSAQNPSTPSACTISCPARSTSIRLRR